MSFSKSSVEYFKRDTQKQPHLIFYPLGLLPVYYGLRHEDNWVFVYAKLNANEELLLFLVYVLFIDLPVQYLLEGHNLGKRLSTLEFYHYLKQMSMNILCGSSQHISIPQFGNGIRSFTSFYLVVLVKVYGTPPL